MSRDQFLLQDYQLKVNYLSNHFARMWTRFNFFLTINAALFAFSFNESYNDSDVMIWAGVLFSIFWFYFGAVDNYLVETYRSHVENSFHVATENLVLKLEASKPAGPTGVGGTACSLSFVGDTGKTCYDGWAKDRSHLEHRRVGWTLLAFRFPGLSATELAAIFPLMFLIAWCVRHIADGSID